MPNTADGPSHPPTLESQLTQGFRGMRFGPALEGPYREAEFRDTVRYLRLNLFLLVILVFTLVQVDRIVIPAFTATVPAGARLGVMVPILLIALGSTFLRGAPLWYPRLMAVLMGVGLMAIAWVGLIAYSQGEDRVFVRLVIATIAVYFVMGLRFRLALGMNLLSIAFYAGAAWSWGMTALVLTQFLAMLLMTSVICIAGAYKLEHARRTAWLEGQLLAEIALRDGLTGIHNRRRLDEHLQRVWHQCVREQKPIALLFADIDCFKPFNDHYGHQAGDEALKAVAVIHSRFGRRPLDMAARFGGEEFAVVLFDTTGDQAQRIGEEIRKNVSALAIAHAQSTAAPILTISVGIGCAQPSAGQSCAGLLLLADHALYAAKGGGRNRVHLLEAAHDGPTAGDFRPQEVIRSA